MSSENQVVQVCGSCIYEMCDGKELGADGEQFYCDVEGHELVPLIKDDDDGWCCPECDAEEIDVDDYESPNIYPYKKCDECGERKSCGSYSGDRKWFCEDCSEESDEESD